MPGHFAIPLGKLLGIQVSIDFTWFLIFFLLLFNLQGFIAEELGLGSAAATLVSALLIILLFASVLAHEYGHALTARAFGIRTPKIVLHIFGGVAFLESEPRKPSHEFWITVAGPAVSLVLGVTFLTALFLFSITNVQMPVLSTICLYIGMMNMVLAIFNCLPGFPMDGGRIVRAAIWGITGNYLLATRIASAGGMAVGGLIAMWGLGGSIGLIPAGAGGGPMQLFLGLFLIFLAWQSARQAELSARLRNISVNDLVRPVNVVVPSDTLISDVLDRYMRPFGMDQLPVVDGPRLAGFISYEDIVQVPLRQWDWVRSAELVRPYSLEDTIDPNLGAMAALQRLMRNNRAFLPVFKGRRLMGFVFRNDLIHALEAGRAQ